MNRSQGGDEVDREDPGEGHELPARSEEKARAGGDALGQGTAHRPRPRTAKAEGWRTPERPVHTAVRT